MNKCEICGYPLDGTRTGPYQWVCPTCELTMQDVADARESYSTAGSAVYESANDAIDAWFKATFPNEPNND